VKKRITSLALASALGLGGMAGGLVLAPSIASAATSDTTVTDAVGERVSDISEALAELVTDGTITQEQSDTIASTLAETLPRGGHGHGGHGGFDKGVSLTSAAEVLNLSEDELRTQLEGGASLASIADVQGVARDTLIAELVESGQARLDEAVAEGRLTQAEADERAADLTERVTETVDREGLPTRGDHRDDRPSDDADDAAADTASTTAGAGAASAA